MTSSGAPGPTVDNGVPPADVDGTAPAELAALFEPNRLDGVDVRTRIVMTGNGTGMAQNHRPSDAHMAYYMNVPSAASA